MSTSTPQRQRCWNSEAAAVMQGCMGAIAVSSWRAEVPVNKQAQRSVRTGAIERVSRAEEAGHAWVQGSAAGQTGVGMPQRSGQRGAGVLVRTLAVGIMRVGQAGAGAASALTLVARQSLQCFQACSRPIC